MDISAENNKIAKHYGYGAQSNQLIEECAELIQAVNKHKRALAERDENKHDIALSNLLEEIADVEIMLSQLKYLLGIKPEDIIAIKQYKVIRTKERIEQKARD